MLMLSNLCILSTMPQILIWKFKAISITVIHEDKEQRLDACIENSSLACYSQDKEYMYACKKNVVMKINLQQFENEFG